MKKIENKKKAAKEKCDLEDRKNKIARELYKSTMTNNSIPSENEKGQKHFFQIERFERLRKRMVCFFFRLKIISAN